MSSRAVTTAFRRCATMCPRRNPHDLPRARARTRAPDAHPLGRKGGFGAGVDEGGLGSRTILVASMPTVRSRAIMIGAATLAAAQPVHARRDLPAQFQAAGVPLQTLVVRARPDPSARVVRHIPRFREDLQFQIVLALSARRGSDGEVWYRLSLPGRPNGRAAGFRADGVDVRPVVNRIVVRLGAASDRGAADSRRQASAPGHRRGRPAGRGDSARP